MEVGLVLLPLLHSDVMLRIPVLIAYAEPTQKIYAFFIVATPLIMVNIVITICMILLYRTVLVQERNLDRFNISGDQNFSLSKRVATQGIYFSGAYFLMWMFGYVYMAINTFFDAQPDWLWILNTIFMPIQGLYNLIVYLIPRYLRFRQEHSEH